MKNIRLLKTGMVTIGLLVFLAVLIGLVQSAHAAIDTDPKVLHTGDHDFQGALKLDGTEVIATANELNELAGNNTFNASTVVVGGTLSVTGAVTFLHSVTIISTNGATTNTFVTVDGVLDGETLGDNTVDDDALDLVDITFDDFVGTITITQYMDIIAISDDSGSTNTIVSNGVVDGEHLLTDSVDDDSLDFGDITGVDFTLDDCLLVSATGIVLRGSTTNTISLSTGLLDGEKIGDDTVDDDALDFVDITFDDFAGTITITQNQDIIAIADNGSATNTIISNGEADGEYLTDDTVDDDALDFVDITLLDITPDYIVVAGTGVLVIATNGTTTNLLITVDAELDGEYIADDTIDDDSIDLSTGAGLSGADMPDEDLGGVAITSSIWRVADNEVGAAEVGPGTLPTDVVYSNDNGVVTASNVTQVVGGTGTWAGTLNVSGTLQAGGDDGITGIWTNLPGGVTNVFYFYNGIATNMTAL